MPVENTAARTGSAHDAGAPATPAGQAPGATQGSGGPRGGARVFTRLTNPVMRALAGHRLFPLWAVMHHRGRTTGRALSVPVAVIATREAFVITLPWGPSTNWVRNVLAADGARLRWRGRDHDLIAPRVIGADEARSFFPPALWPIAQRVIGAEHFLLATRRAAA